MRTAVVLGAGIAGLLAARVLTQHAEEVVLVDRDDLTVPDVSELPRRGVPQGTQMHVLLEAGRRGVEQWLPGFTDELLAAGAARATTDNDTWSYLDGARKVAAGDLPLLGATRPFIEAHIRRRVVEAPNVRLVTASVQGLSFSGDRVDGVRISAGEHGTEHEVLHADLVVDATGRGTRIGAWLTENGWPEPPLERMPVDLGYATAVFRASDDDPAMDAGGATVAHSMSTTADGKVRVSTLSRIEGNRWIALTAGYADDKPTRSAEEFLTRCREEPADAFNKLVANARLEGEIAVYRHPDNRRRDFHRVDRFPAGLVCIGDTVASFNPVYGQGMSSAAAQASLLQAELEAGRLPGEPATRYFAAVRRVVDDAWQTSVLNDLRMPHVPGKRPVGFRMMTGIGDMILRATVTDPVVGLRFVEVLHMIQPPSALTKPGILARAVRARFRSGR